MVDLTENTFLFASAVGAPCEGFLGLTSGFAKTALIDQIIHFKIYPELPGLDFPVLTKDVSSYEITNFLNIKLFQELQIQPDDWLQQLCQPRHGGPVLNHFIRTLQRGSSHSHTIEMDS